MDPGQCVRCVDGADGALASTTVDADVRTSEFAMEHLREALSCIANVRLVVYESDGTLVRNECACHGYSDVDHFDVCAGLDWLIAHLFTRTCARIQSQHLPAGEAPRGDVCVDVSLGMLHAGATVAALIDAVRLRVSFYSAESLLKICDVVVPDSRWHVPGHDCSRATRMRGHVIVFPQQPELVLDLLPPPHGATFDLCLRTFRGSMCSVSGVDAQARPTSPCP